VRVAVGLSAAEAQRRLTGFGPNEIRREQVISPLTLLVALAPVTVIEMSKLIRRASS
jgi:hypothetical protein